MVNETFENFDWLPVAEFKELNELIHMPAKKWKQYRVLHGLNLRNINGVWMISKGIDDDTDDDEIVESEFIDTPVKCSVVSFSGLVVANHAPIQRVQITGNTFNMAGMYNELDSFNQQLAETDRVLDEATKLLQNKAVELELTTEEKRRRLSLLDDKILATRTQAKLLRDKSIVTSIESDNLNREFVGKQTVLTEVVDEVRSLLS